MIQQFCAIQWDFFYFVNAVNVLVAKRFACLSENARKRNFLRSFNKTAAITQTLVKNKD
jgi:hypothetical protein